MAQMRLHANVQYYTYCTFMCNREKRLKSHPFQFPVPDQLPLNIGGSASLFPLLPCSGGRRLAAARTVVSDCAGFAPNKPQPCLSLPALSLTPCPPPIGLRLVLFTVPF